MASHRRSALELAAGRQLKAVLVREGAKVRRARKRRRWTQLELGHKCGLAQTTMSRIERGDGGSLSVQTWQQVALVLGLTLDVSFGRDPMEAPADAGHLDIEELVLRMARPHGFKRTFELPTRPSDPSLSTDVGLRDDARRLLIQVECVNTFGNVNASVRSSDRKRAEAEALAISIGYGDPYAVRQVWVVRATRRNRALIARYPEIFGTRFPGSSKGWVAALVGGSEPPTEPGLVWCDVRATRIVEWRRSGARRQRG